MTCITINNKEALREMLAKDGKTDIALMLGKAGVMDSVSHDTNMNLKLSSKVTLKNVILTDSYEDLNLSLKEGVEVGKSLQKLLGLKANPINISNGTLIYANNFNQVKASVNDLINARYNVSKTAENNVPLYLIETPLIKREERRIELSKKKLGNLRREHNTLLKEKAGVQELKAIQGKMLQVEGSIERSNDFIKSINKFKSLQLVKDKFENERLRIANMLSKAHTLTDEEIKELQETTRMWLLISNKKDNLLELDENVEWQNERIRKDLSEISDFFGYVKGKLDVIVVDYIERKFKKEGNIETKEEMFRNFNIDDPSTTRRYRGWTRSINPLITLLAKIVNKASTLARVEYKKVEEEIESKFKEAKKQAGFSIDLLLQVDKQGRKVGNMLDRFSFEYLRDIKLHRDRTKRANKNWFLNNTLVLDFKMFFDDTSDSVPDAMLSKKSSAKEKKDFQAHAKELLGENGYNEYMEIMQQQFEEYKDKRDTAWEIVEAAPAELRSQEIVKFKNIMDYMSPFIQSNHAITMEVKDYHGNFIRRNSSLEHRIPRKVNNKGENLGYYDKNFKIVEANPAMYEIYQYARGIVQDARINFNYSLGLAPNALPYLKKTLSQQLFQSNNPITKKMSLLSDAFKLAISGNEAKIPTELELSQGVTSTGAVAANVFKYKALEFENKHGRAPTATEEEELMRDSYAESAEDQDFDLIQLLKVLTMNGLLYKNRLAIQNTVDILKAEVVSPVVGENGKEQRKDIDNSIALMNNSLNSNYYSVKTTKMQGSLSKATNKKGVLTEENDRRSKILEERITQIQESEQDPTKAAIKIADLQEIKEGLYREVQVSEMFRKFLSISRVLGIGWNVISSSANLAYGQIGNIQRAIQGDYFNLPQLKYAMGEMMSHPELAEKISDLIGLVGDVAYSFKDISSVSKGSSTMGKIFKWLNPYRFQTVSEGYNQKPIMIAIMRNHDVFRGKEESNLYEIVKANNGVMDDTWTDVNGRKGNEIISDITETVRSVVSETHGDYTSTLEGNNMAGYQALMMYRRWLPEMMARRWGPEGIDPMTGKNTHGIYRVVMKKGGKVLSGKGWDSLTEEEKGKMKAAVIGDLIMYLMLKGLGAIMKGLLCGEDDPKCKDAPAILVGAINILRRVEREVSFFANPFEIGTIVTEPISSVRTFTDIFKFFSVLNTFWNQDDKKSYYRSGRNKDRHKGKVALIRLSPMYNQYDRLMTYGNETTYEIDWGSTWGKLTGEDKIGDKNKKKKRAAGR